VTILDRVRAQITPAADPPGDPLAGVPGRKPADPVITLEVIRPQDWLAKTASADQPDAFEDERPIWRPA